MSIFTRDFWIASAERAVKTFAQALVAVGGADMLGVLGADWQAVLLTALSAVLLSFATSVASSKASPEPSPALFGAERIPAADRDVAKNKAEDAVDNEDTDKPLVAPPGFIVDDNTPAKF